MPLNVRRFGASCLVFLILAGAVFAQTTGASNEDMKQRLARARALVAVKSYTPAAFELEKIRKESSDPSVQNIALTLLMNCYLENGDYRHSQELLNETFDVVKSSKGASSSSYFTASGQLVKMARGQMERYKQLGLNVADANMPAEVTVELEKMRGTLELVVNQVKELSDIKKRSAEAFGLLEEVTNTRSAMARDAYDATRWKNEVADARERLSNSQNSVVNVVDEPVTGATDVAQNNNGAASAVPTFTKVSAPPPPPVQTETQAARDILKDDKTKTGEPIIVGGDKNKNATPGSLPESIAAKTANGQSETRTQTVGEKNAAAPAENKGSETAATSVGSMVDMATKKVQPVYPQMARNMRVGGVVKIDVLVDEQGSVLSVQAVQGPEVLKRAAIDAVKQWKFRPVVRDGQPTKASGFINFNFSL